MVRKTNEWKEPVQVASVQVTRHDAEVFHYGEAAIIQMAEKPLTI